jgi:O-antigen/teichoic acid export membrane protein
MVSIASLASAGMISVAIRFIGGIIQGYFIGPELLGYYTKFTILPGYMFFLHLGVFTSLARQYPYLIGKGEREEALSYAANAQGWTIILCAVHAVTFLVPCLWAAVHGDYYAAMGWGAQVVLTNVSLYMFYLGSTYRSSSEFVAWSKGSIISSIASFLLLPLVIFFQFIGICFRYTIPDVISMIYAHQHRPLRILPRVDRMVLRKMILFGAPLMVFAYISTPLWTAIERSYILKMLGEKPLGIFAFAGSLYAALHMVATSISQVFHPRIAMLYGSSGKNMKTSFYYCIKCSLVGLIMMLPVVALAHWLIAPLVEWFVPKYVECIPIARCLFWLTLIPVIDLPKQLLIVAKKIKQFGISIILSFTLFLTLLAIYAFSADNITLLKIVIASVLCKLISVFISNVFSWHIARSESPS